MSIWLPMIMLGLEIFLHRFRVIFNLIRYISIYTSIWKYIWGQWLKSTLSMLVAWCGIHLSDPRHQHPPSDNNPWLCDQMIMITRCSENDNTPQPLDQWTNSPFMGQQVGNCKSFTLTHNLADLFAMHYGPRASPLCVQYCIQLTSLSFQVNRTSHS